MKKIQFTSLLLFFVSGLIAQFNNEWIDFSKTYYKIKVASNGIYRLSKSNLDAAGLRNTEAQAFQLWSNGIEVPLYTSSANGVLAGNGFIEFYGEKNDGKVDKNIYRNRFHQLTDKVSLFTDTAVYFLTVNTASANRRFITRSNDLNALPAPAAYVWANLRHDYKNSVNGEPYVNKGEAADYGEYVYSSSYERGEMMSSNEIYTNQGGNDNSNKKGIFNNLFAYTSGGLSAKLKVSYASTYSKQVSDIRISLNNTIIGSKRLNPFESRVDSFTNISPANLENNTTLILQNVSTGTSSDFNRFVAGFAEIDYPRQPNAGNLASFRFYLPASGAKTYLEISNFSDGGVAPVLYNISTGERIVTNVSNGLVKVVVPPSDETNQFILVAQAEGGYTNTTINSNRNFINYKLAANQGTYLIISNKILMQGNNNPVEQYRNYRSSAAGGSYTANIYEIDQLVDQFAFGIKMHPLSVKNFLGFARQYFSAAPKFCFLIGKGVHYIEAREKESNPKLASLQLVPSFGFPPSDNLLASADLTALPATPIGRLSIVSGTELTDYLDKIKEAEAAQANPSQTQEDKAWMKNIVHVVGANDESTANLITPYMDNYKRIIEDTLYGGKVTTFNKFNTTTASTIENEQLSTLFQKGFSLLTYFGHSSATVLDYNLDDPSIYNNPGKYPVFLLNGCNAGNFFEFDSLRYQIKATISEKYLLAKNRGAIAMIASTHFGIVNGLGLYSNGFYQSIANKSYNQSLGKNMQDAVRYMYQTWGMNDFSARIHSEQQTLHGDPAFTINSFQKPDYSIETSNVIINPSFISIAETNFRVKLYHYNLGKAIKDSITVEVKREYPKSAQYPNGFTEMLYKQKIKAPLFTDSLELILPILPERDKGINKITVSLETENRISELSESNNTITTDVVVFEDDLRPVYPYGFSIVNKQGIKLIASTGNPFSASKNYRMELDTTEKFNSPAKINREVTATGGIVSFDPGITFKDSTVYYWRLAVVPATGNPTRWNTSSFVYLAGNETGFNQSHFFQHTKSDVQNIFMDSSSNSWKFGTMANSLVINHSVFGTPGYTDDANISVFVNSSTVSASACIGHSIIFNVFDPITFRPLRNYPGGAYGSGMNNCVANNLVRQNNFEWNDQSADKRQQMAAFMDAIPNGSYVVVRKILDPPYPAETYAATMKADEQVYGAGNTLYSKLKQAGFTNLDSFNRPRTFIFVYKKNDPSFKAVALLSETENDAITLKVEAQTPDTLGLITSPVFGPALSWKQVLWQGNSIDSKAGDQPTVDVIGIGANGNETTLFTLKTTQQSFDISQVSATSYPFMKLRMRNADSINGTAYNLRWWRLYYSPVPEGALAGNISLQAKDSLQQGEALDFKIAFKNISETAFSDSLKLKVMVTDRNNVTRAIEIPKKKALIAGDTATISFSVDTRGLSGLNTLYLAVNPDNDQPEQYFFNNFLYKNFFVFEDTYNPLLDVTFDGIHILNRDIVSAKPHISIKLKDENNFLALNDTAGLVLKLKYPNESNARVYNWGSDTLRFTPADLTSGDNTATIDFTPVLSEDSENSEYELTVSGKDRLGNRAGKLEYRVTFQVFNKPMISNMLNFPNPFSTSTAFVFTITGSEVPQEFKIQILTITGKIVKEITRQELGDIRMGTNVTDYKWDGTDTYGQKLANGVYLYRVITSLDGKKLDKFRLSENFDQQGKDNTDQFFNKGYGKMVILR
ncbi:MAG: C25 family cysteine peptidase [Bacteroidota bacterium]